MKLEWNYYPFWASFYWLQHLNYLLVIIRIIIFAVKLVFLTLLDGKDRLLPIQIRIYYRNEVFLFLSPHKKKFSVPKITSLSYLVILI